MVLLFLAVIVAVYALIKRQYVIALMGVEIGVYGALQELLRKPELAQYGLYLSIGGKLCLLALAVTAVWLAVGRGMEDGRN